MDKVLVCITPQTNSHRLIDKAAEEAALLNGEFLILNVNKGDSVFDNENSAEMLDNLFRYGAKKGGSIHALCGDDIPSLIASFAANKKITKIIMGEPLKQYCNLYGNDGIIDKIKTLLENNSQIEIFVLKREKN